MGRPEAPIDYTIPELGKCAEFLRAMRHAAGLTYTALAAVTNYSPAHLKRAARGEWTSPDVVQAYAKACVTSNEDVIILSEVMAQHRAATDAIREAEREARRAKVVPKPQYARDEADLSGAMRDAWARAARPTSRFIETASEGQVPSSTAHTIIKGRNVPKDVRQYVAFLKVCGISGDGLEPWFRAWVKVRGLPSEAERWLAHRWMEPAVGALYLAAVLDGVKSRTVVNAPTMTTGEWSQLRTVMAEVQESLAEFNRERTSSVIGERHGLAVVGGQNPRNSPAYASMKSPLAA
ncbi:helix-turn-helix transcriptional regulator [Streptomyces sp. NPDC007206]|uniref:helix-turn-helix domain-containing protein n=1 Tax=Streptomyces sp. NPDC007206 TaxID=3154317 RepID=UPI0033E494C4